MNIIIITKIVMSEWLLSVKVCNVVYLIYMLIYVIVIIAAI